MQDLGKFSTNIFRSLEKAGVKLFHRGFGESRLRSYANVQLPKMTVQNYFIRSNSGSPSQLVLIPATIQHLGTLLPSLKPGKPDSSQSFQNPGRGPGHSPMVKGRRERFPPPPLFPPPPPSSSQLGPGTPQFSQEAFRKDLCVLIRKGIFFLNSFNLE